MALAHAVAERLDELLRLGLRQGTLYRRTRLTARQVRLIRLRPADVDPTFAARASARLDDLGPRDVLRDRLGELRDDGLGLAALARESGLDEAEIGALLDNHSGLDDDRATATLESLAAARWVFDRLIALAHTARGCLDVGLTRDALARWLAWQPSAVDLLLAGSLDLDDGELGDAERRLSEIPHVEVVGNDGRVAGMAFDRKSADDAAHWWDVFDPVEAGQFADATPLAAFRAVDVLLARRGQVLAVRLPDDRDTPLLRALIERKRRADRRARLPDLFPRADGSAPELERGEE